MSLRYLITLLGLFNYLQLAAQNNAPEVRQQKVSWDSAQQKLRIEYNLFDEENDITEVRLGYYKNDEAVWFSDTQVSGDVGKGVIPGIGKSVMLDIKLIFVEQGIDLIILADDHVLPDMKMLVDQVQKHNLERHVRFLEGERSTRNKKARLQLQKARDYIVDHMQNLSLSTAIQDTTMSFYELLSVVEGESGGSQEKYPISNVLGKKKGLLNPQKQVMLGAHYDSAPKSPGANDNATGVAALLEVSRILSQYTFKKSVSFAGLDQEERELLGAGALVFGKGGLINNAGFEGLINLDMIGAYSEQPNSQIIPEGFESLFPNNYTSVEARDFAGNFVLVVSNRNSEIIGNSIKNVANEGVDKLNVEHLVLEGIGDDSGYFQRGDHFPFWIANLKAVHIGDGAETRYASYHSKKDTFDKVNFNFVQKVTSMVLLSLYEQAEPCHCGVSGLFVEQEMFAQHLPVNK